MKTKLTRLLLLAATLVITLAACSQKTTDVDPATGLSVSPAQAELTVGETVQMLASLELESGKVQESTDVTWVSTDDTVATVDADGLVTAVAEGTVTITATAKEQVSLSGNASITVIAADEDDPEDPGDGDDPEDGEDPGEEPGGGEDPGQGGEPGAGDPGDGRVVLSSSSLDLVRTQTVGIEAEVDVEGDTTGRVSWYSSDTSVVEVSPTGDARAMLKAVGVGTSTITATSTADSDAYASMKVTVSSLGIDISLALEVPVEGESGTVTATVSGLFEEADAGVRWSVVEGELVLAADESESGAALAVTANGSGSMTLRATSLQDNEVSADLTFQVDSKDTAFTLDPLQVYVGPWTPVRAEADEGTRYNPFDTFKEALDAVASGGEIRLADSTYVLGSGAHPYIDEPVRLIGQSRDGTVIELQGVGSGQYGFTIYSGDVHIENLTVNGSGGRTFKIQPNPPVDSFISGISFENVTVTGEGQTQIDFHSATGVSLKNVHVQGSDNQGVGISFTTSFDVLLDGVTTAGHLWGGVAFFDEVNGLPRPAAADTAVSIINSAFAENPPIYTQQKNKNAGFEELHFDGFEFAVLNPDHKTDGAQFVFYFDAAAAAENYAVNLDEATSSTIQRVDASDSAVLTNTYLVFPDMNLQRAVDASPDDADDVLIEVQGGVHNLADQTLNITKPLTLQGMPGSVLETELVEGTVIDVDSPDGPVTISGLEFFVSDQTAHTSGGNLNIVRAWASGGAVSIVDNHFRGTFDGNYGSVVRAMNITRSSPDSFLIEGNTFDKVTHVLYVNGPGPGWDSTEYAEIDVRILNNHAIGTRGWVVESRAPGAHFEGNSFEDHKHAYMITFTGGEEEHAHVNYGADATMKKISEDNNDAIVRVTGGGTTKVYPAPQPD